MTTNNLLYMALGSGLIALAFAWWKTQWINRCIRARPDAGNRRGGARRGLAFLKREYVVRAWWWCCAYVGHHTGAVRLVSLAFVFGAFCSALSGFGMRVATAANIARQAARTAAGAPGGVFRWRGHGMAWWAGLTGLTDAVRLRNSSAVTDGVMELAGVKGTILPILTGFSMGASSLRCLRAWAAVSTPRRPMSARSGRQGGSGHSRGRSAQPAVIADNVGDNVATWRHGRRPVRVLRGRHRGGHGKRCHHQGWRRMEYRLHSVAAGDCGRGHSVLDRRHVFVKTKEGGNSQTLNQGTSGPAGSGGGDYFIRKGMLPDEFAIPRRPAEPARSPAPVYFGPRWSVCWPAR